MMKTLKVYHYTNAKAYNSMATGCDFDKKGLQPLRRFIRYGRGSKTLPEDAREGVIEALLEPEPKYCLENPKFPHWWEYLMFDICREKQILLLSFEIKKKDLAFVVERAHIERELYKEEGKSTKRTMNLACRRYYDSRIPALEYKGGYNLAQLAIWSPIDFKRLKIEWIKHHSEVWQRVKDNGW